MLLSGLVQTVLWAQDSTTSTKSTSVEVTKSTTSEWMTSPWVWVIGGAVFILLLVALLNGRKSRDTVSSDRVSVTKTVERDTDV